MKELALRYSDTKLTNMTFSDSATNQFQFQTVKCTEPVINTSVDSGILLNGRIFNHVLYKHKDLEVVISSDEITDDILEFLQSFWSAAFKYIAINKNAVWGNYVEVLTESGKFPLSYINDIKILPEVSFSLFYVEPL